VESDAGREQRSALFARCRAVRRYGRRRPNSSSWMTRRSTAKLQDGGRIALWRRAAGDKTLKSVGEWNSTRIIIAQKPGRALVEWRENSRSRPVQSFRAADRRPEIQQSGLGRSRAGPHCAPAPRQRSQLPKHSRAKFRRELNRPPHSRNPAIDRLRHYFSSGALSANFDFNLRSRFGELRRDVTQDRSEVERGTLACR